MLELTDEAWEKYEHAYGVASDIPKLLKALSAFPKQESYESEPYYSLWSSLCHQGDIYQASYAAVPHIVEILHGAPENAPLDFFLLPTCVEIARKKGSGPVIASELEADYQKALVKLLNCVAKANNNSPECCSVLSATVAVCGGEYKLAEVILELNEEVINEFWGWYNHR